MLKRIVQIFGGDPSKKEIERHTETIDEINALETEFEQLSDAALSAKTGEFKRRLDEGESLDDLLVEAFATVREASKRTLGMRHFDVQLIGGIVLHQGKIAEMRTGEGKTLVATLPLYLNALTGKGTHLITVNDYLARRDARWMFPIFQMLGLSVGVLQMASRTENGKRAFLVDPERESPHEDQHQLAIVPRREAYHADITYGTNSEYGFDYLRDNMTMRLEDRVQRGHNYAIIDEVDNVLIDEARTPLIISGPAHDDTEWYVRMAQVVRQLRPEDYEINERDRSITLTEIGELHVENLLDMPLRDPDRPEDVTPEQARLIGYLEQALRAQYLFKRNKDYLVQAGRVVIIDEFTGRLMPGRRWSDGLHQAVEAKEGVRVQPENVTYATITIQNYFRMYAKLSGMTGTAVTEAEEFNEIYKLEVLAIPTNLEYQASREEFDLEAHEGRDELNYKYTYYTYGKDPDQEPVFWKRKDYPDIVYRSVEAKLRALTREIMEFHVLGRPILVGTTSVELSDRVSTRLKADQLRRLTQVLLLRDRWFEVNQREEDGRQVEDLQYLNAPVDDLDISTMRKMARELDISFNPEDEDNIARMLRILGIPHADPARLASILKGGIPHQVLNARKHTEESQIIADAGAFGAVTIATNMAGRGVDIKLGGEVDEDVLADVNRVLRRAGHDDPYDMTLGQRHKAVQALDPEDYGIYKPKIEAFLEYIDKMKLVRDLGGLHVIGSERHEARRIDNQLRGRAARQGDPGSSRFYLSMEDDLMRLFGGEQADNLMQRMRIDDAMPLEVGLVSRIVEQSQTRVEGANFDVRKHLLEYDDVLNTQRAKIYAQRDRIFTKEDLSEDVEEMLETEVNLRVPDALENEEGAFRLLSWMDQIQPPFTVNGNVFPSYTLKLLANWIGDERNVSADEPLRLDKEQAVQALLQVATKSVEAEESHLLRMIDGLLLNTQMSYEQQLADRREAVDTFFEGLELADETDTRGPRQLVDDLANNIRVPLRLSSSEQRSLREDPDEVEDVIYEQVEEFLARQTVIRLMGAIERRLDDSLDVERNDLPLDDWDALADMVLDGIEEIYARRKERLLGDDSLIARDLNTALSKTDGQLGRSALYQLLMMMPQGSKAAFDKKTHKRVFLRTTRLTYIYFASQFLENRDPAETTQDVLEHLQATQQVVFKIWGLNEIARLAESTPGSLDAVAQDALRAALGDSVFESLAATPLGTIREEHRNTIVETLGRRALTELYRQLLLSVITELWVEYLTQMEALRVSIGLEAYAQRDPLVQYKNRAYALFQELLGNMRQGVVTRMFTYRPRDMSSVQSATSQVEPVAQARIPETAEPAEDDERPESDKSKSKRRRRRRRSK